MQIRGIVEGTASLGRRLDRWLQALQYHGLAWLALTFDSDDLTIRRIATTAGGEAVVLAYLDDMADTKRVYEEVEAPIESALLSSGGRGVAERLRHGTRASDRQQIVEALLSGQVAVFVGEAREAWLVEASAEPTRKVGQPTTEILLLGPKEAFTENLRVNLALVRRRLGSADLRVRVERVGRRSRTAVAVLYLDGVADPEMAGRLLNELPNLDVDHLRSALDLERLLVQRSLTPFPLAQRTERTDFVCSALVEGRLALLMDGSPFAVLLPTTVLALQRGAEVFAGGGAVIAFVRWLRLIATMVALTAPALYVTVLTVQPTLLPPDTLIAVAATREGVPYPVAFEAFVMMIVLDVVIEATQSVPTTIAQTVTIVGSLIIGQAAVQARLASELMVTVLAMTAIGSLLVVNLPLAYTVRLLKYPLVAVSAVLGVYGLMLGLITITAHMASLKSWGVPYLTPAGPLRWRDLRNYGPLNVAPGYRRLRPASYHPADDVRSAPAGRRSPPA